MRKLNEPSHLDLRCLTFSLSTLLINVFPNDSLIKRTRGPWWSYIAHLTKQICIFTVEVSAKFTALGFLYKLYSTNHPNPTAPHPPATFFFYKSWQIELNLKKGSPKEHFCQVILKLVQWFKKFYIAIKPYALTAMFFDESWQLEQTWLRVTKGTFLLSYIEICSVVSDKKIFKVFYLDI